MAAWATPAAQEPSSEQGTPGAQLLLQRCEKDRQIPAGTGSWECAASRKVQPPPSSPQCQSHPLAIVLLFQRGNSQLLTLLGLS